ncbi:MAG: DegT/DnrJ/EryC1/StrS family aminotransferase [Nitrospirae bacterium]|nr:DegT/DnrJ/EryC1/StrS family aminotransferase [Nitrospirota bacterium]
MIPRHSLPFGPGTAFSFLVSSAPAPHLSDTEKAYADTLGVRAVLLLPSVRAGIHMVIRAAYSPAGVVVAPAYTCGSVHQALALSGVSARLVDSAPGAFLMAPEDICAACESGCALVLSEVYGIPYARELPDGGCGKRARVRVLDMAMSIPSAGRLAHLKASDIGLFSFGWGKPMYAGWGGIACFQDAELAGRVREIRDRWTSPESSGLRFQHACSTLLRVAMNQRRIYGLLHQRHLYRLLRTVASAGHKRQYPAPPGETASHTAPDEAPPALPREWTRPPTALNRKLALYDLHNAVQNADLRQRQAETYFRLLVEPGMVCGPGGNALPQSHFPLRLPSAARDRMCDYLRSRGIDTSTLFPFPAGVSRGLFPNAAKASDEVIALPLGPALTLDEVRAVSKCVEDGMRELA